MKPEAGATTVPHGVPERSPRTELHNRLLLALPPAAQTLVYPRLEWVQLHKHAVLREPGMTLGRLYFIDRGMVSLVKHMADGRSVEIGAVGIEGLVEPFGIFHSSRALMQSIVQLPGSAFAIARSDLHRAMEASTAVRNVMQRYVGVAMSQLVQTAACNGLHSLEQRTARWLLTARDNALNDDVPLTHEFLAMMLAVHRASVSFALGILQDACLIRCGRGRITVIDRGGLERTACECYRTIRNEIEREFGGS